MKLLEMGKDMKIKHSVFSPLYKVWETVFSRKTLHGKRNVFRPIFWGMFYMGNNDQIMQVGVRTRWLLMGKRFQR